MQRSLLCLFMGLVFFLSSPPVWAEEKPLTGADIEAKLAGNTAFGEQNGKPWKQFFHANGQTIYVAAGDPPSPGKWRVNGDQFCSQWPPRDSWDCYHMTGEGDQVTWIFPGSGDPWPATIKPGDQLDQ